jgi:FkbM family methyltransferase
MTEPRPFAARLRCPIRLEAFSVLARVIKHAAYSEDFPPTQASLWSIHHDLQTCLRGGHPEWIHNDRLHVRFPDRDAMAVVDLRNTQFIGADRGIASFAAGYEPDIALLVEACVRDDGVLVDVGANWGYFPLFLAARPGFAGRVLAVEGFPSSAAQLRAVIDQTGIGALVEAVPVALGAAPGMATMAEETFSGNNRLEGGGGVAVPVDTLDAVMAARGVARCDLLKLDVEGAEAAVIQGGRATIARHRPVVVFEHWLDAAAGVDAAPFDALSAIAPHVFHALEILPADAVDPAAEEAELRFRLHPVTPATRASLPARINVIASAPEADLPARLLARVA